MWTRRKPVEARLDAELRYHFERLVRDSIAAGMAPDEARRRARLEFGGVEQIKEECRDARGRWLEDLGKDLQYAARTLRRSPAFLMVSVLSLALGIGANTAIFSLINAVMLRPLPVKEPDRLVQTTRVALDGTPGNVSYLLFRYFRDNLKSISSAAVEMQSSPAIVIDGVEEMVSAELVTGEHYSVLGIEPAAGRLLEPADDELAPATPAAVISYRYWQRRFGLNPAVIGKTFTLRIKQSVYTIVGVTPERYQGTRVGLDPDLTLPLSVMFNDNQRADAGMNWFNMLARLAPGVTIGQANAELQVVWRRFAERMAAAAPEKDRPAILNRRAVVVSAAGGLNPFRDDYAAALLLLMGMVALVLLLACANLSGLLLARAAAREREIAIRLAIGAGGGRLLRQFLAESSLLAALGGAAGLLLAQWFIRALMAMMASGQFDGNLLLPTAPDWRVLSFTGAISVLACILAGLAPGLHALRANLNPGLRQARAGGQHFLGKSLVVAQLSISMVLVVGAALFVGTLASLYRVDRGVRTEGILTFRVRTGERYPAARRWAAIGAMVDRLNALPGVASASAADILPLSGFEFVRGVRVEGYRYAPGESQEVAFNVIAPKYFGTVSTPVLSGREFDARDISTSNKVAIVNERFARYFFGAQSPLGRRVTVTGVNSAYEIVGVVRDGRRHLRQDILKSFYIPMTQRGNEQPNAYSFLARVEAGDPTRLVPFLQKLVPEVDPEWRLLSTQTYSSVVERTLATERIMAVLASFFGLLALLVACLGIFGAMAFQVSRRVNEIGLRMALGASRSGIVALVLREVAVLLVAGCLIGGGAALSLTGLTRSMLFGVTPNEPRVFTLAAVVLGMAAFAAGWLPARRASRVDPMVALRHE